MKSNGLIRMENDAKVHISGEMTFSSTPGLYREFENSFQSMGPEIEIDLGEVERADSSGLALLLEWQALATQQQRKLKFTNAADNLLKLARLCEADTLLDISAR